MPTRRQGAEGRAQSHHARGLWHASPPRRARCEPHHARRAARSRARRALPFVAVVSPAPNMTYSLAVTRFSVAASSGLLLALGLSIPAARGDAKPTTIGVDEIKAGMTGH